MDIRLEAVNTPEGDFIDEATELTVDILKLCCLIHIFGPLLEATLNIVRLGNIVNHHLELWKLAAMRGMCWMVAG